MAHSPTVVVAVVVVLAVAVAADKLELADIVAARFAVVDVAVALVAVGLDLKNLRV